MSSHESTRSPRTLQLAIALSLALHGGVLLLSRHSSPVEGRAASRLEATLGRPAPAIPIETPPASSVIAPVKPSKPVKNPRASNRILTVDKPSGAASASKRQWSVAEKDEMNQFMNELAGQAQARPSLAQRSLAMADELGQRQARQGQEENVTLERIPGSPPIDRFSLEMYMDGLLKKLNRSAAFVKNDPRTRGVRNASVEIRLNPNGSLKSFEVLDAGDQRDEIAFIRSVVEQAVPFPSFPDDMRRSAQSLAMTICILPTGSGNGFGFTRNPAGRGC